MDANVARHLYFVAQRLRREPVLRVLRELELSERWPPHLLRDAQWRLQRRLVRYAYDHVPFYRERWRAIGFAPDDLQSPDDWARLPILEKSDVQAHGAAMRSQRPQPGVPATTSGSSGTPLTVHRSHLSWAHAHANVFRGWRWQGVRVGDRYALFWGTSLDGGRGRIALRDWFFNRTRCSAFELESADCAAIYRRLLKHPVRFAFGYPSALSSFADGIEGLGLDGRALEWRVVITSAETLRVDQRERLHSAFGCQVVDSYGCAEIGVAGFECGHGTMHVPVESVVVETISSPDGPKEILLTDLHNHSQPMIRYRVGDLVASDADDPQEAGICPCGVGLPALGPTQGRAGDVITLPDGRRVNANLPSYLLKRHGRSGAVRQYQFLQDASRNLELRVAPGPAWTARVRDELAEEVRRSFGVPVPIRVVPRCERSGRGKHRDVVQIEDALFPMAAPLEAGSRTPRIEFLEPRGPVALRVAAIGDVALVGRGRLRGRIEGYDAAFRAFKPALGRADVALANLEAPLGEGSWLRPGATPGFHQDPEVITAMAGAGIRVVSFANNHALDCGERGLCLTLESCAAAGVTVIGAGYRLEEARRPWRGVLNGRRVAILAYGAASPRDAAGPRRAGIAPLDGALIREDLTAWRPRVDVLVASVHWGAMYVDDPPPRVTALARRLAEWGADLVIGHHPHVVQGFSRHGSNLTLFSLGDAVFPPGAGEIQTSVGAERRRQGAVFTALVGASPGLEAEPFELDADGFPRAATSEAAGEFRQRILDLAAAIGQAERNFFARSAPLLMRYEFDAALQYLRRGRIDRLARLAGGIRPRHLGMLGRTFAVGCMGGVAALFRGRRSREGKVGTAANG